MSIKTIHDLSDKDLFNIFSLLDSESFIASSQVCQKWNLLISENMDFFASLFADDDSEDDDSSDAPDVHSEEMIKKRKIEAQRELEDSVQTQLSIINQINTLAPNQYAEILGVSEEADTEEIRRQFRRLSLLIHPDKCKLEGAHKAFQTLKKAFDIIIGGVDPEDPNSEKMICPNRDCKALVYMEKEKHALIMKGGDTGLCRACKGKFGRVFCCHCFASWTMPIELEKTGKLMQCSKCKKKFAIAYPTPAVRKDVMKNSEVNLKKKKAWWQH